MDEFVAGVIVGAILSFLVFSASIHSSNEECKERFNVGHCHLVSITDDHILMIRPEMSLEELHKKDILP